MEKLKQLITEQRYVEAKQYTLDNREEIEDIADTLLGMIDELCKPVYDSLCGLELEKCESTPLEDVKATRKRLKESLESTEAATGNPIDNENIVTVNLTILAPIEYHLRYIEEEFNRKTLECFAFKYEFIEVNDVFLVNFDVDGKRILSSYVIKEEDIKNKNFSIVDDLIWLANNEY